MKFIGEFAALATASLFGITAWIFTSTGRAVGSQVTNRLRLSFALIYLMILNLILFHEPLPFSTDASRWLWLSLSGIIGLSLGDAFLFQSFVAVGPRLGSLLLSLAPIFSAIIAWLFFGETLTMVQIIGIVFALAGIAWVIASTQDSPNAQQDDARRGVIFGILAALGQTAGLVLSKKGMSGDFPPFQGNAIRMLAAVIFIWVWTAFDRNGNGTFSILRAKPQVIPLLMIGAFIGPVLAVSLSLFSVQHAVLGVASTLMSLTPVIILPISHFVFKEKIGWQAILGTALAIAGVAVLFLA
jgi:drug/metabolite transporter (DMT)-like permease